ncbi:cell division transport system permease protein [Oryzomicrobium terrae]|uniref:Cell division protein FtsX n=1 Tax=Oryzomicrobium terrae TaxID=1735038 RepID=A0A5C1E4S6_9RHOO|nr:permease-like cell division protein FtsX [Oryzomicrobium terrae]QEL63873.1 cell division transport system permease protein [Oryzomicrobium terrae]
MSLAHHHQALTTALVRLRDAPFNALLSLLVIGIALALPAAGWVALDNVRLAASGLAEAPEVSLFLEPGAGRDEVKAVEQKLRDAGAPYRFVAKDAALERLKAREGLADLVANLPKNPLPDAFVADMAGRDATAVERFVKTAGEWPRVAHVQFDSAWMRRLDAFLRLGRLAVVLLAGVFGVGLIAATFNTIRLQMLARAQEIEVARLIGATPGFVSRPYAYYGALQGILGGLLAAALVALAFFFLSGPVGELTRLYGSGFRLRGPSMAEVGALCAAGALLGWLGARLSVALYLRQQPQ